MDEILWDTDIGEAAVTMEGFDEWKLLADLAPVQKKERKRSAPHQRRKKKEQLIEKKVEEWIKGTDRPVIRSYVKLPTRELRSVWNNCTPKMPLSEEDRELAQKAMQNVHVATMQLRSCYSEMAIEKASLQVSVVLLELASQKACYDPFACLQHAASFASQGLKAGSSDIQFRRPLPDIKECTSIEALVILGRADCLQALYFPNESAFLCSYVARVCRSRRRSADKALEWNDQWRILSILAFNVSVLIRVTVNTVLDKEMRKSFLSIWERDVVEELEIARRDGWLWKRKYVSSKNGKSSNLIEHGDDDDDSDEMQSDIEEAEQQYTNTDGTEEAAKPETSLPVLLPETVAAGIPPPIDLGLMDPFAGEELPSLDFESDAFAVKASDETDELEMLVVSV